VVEWFVVIFRGKGEGGQLCVGGLPFQKITCVTAAVTFWRQKKEKNTHREREETTPHHTSEMAEAEDERKGAVVQALLTKATADVSVAELREIYRFVWPSTVAEFGSRYGVAPEAMAAFISAQPGHSSPSCDAARALRRFVDDVKDMAANDPAAPTPAPAPSKPQQDPAHAHALAPAPAPPDVAAPPRIAKHVTKPQMVVERRKSAERTATTTTTTTTTPPAAAQHTTATTAPQQRTKPTTATETIITQQQQQQQQATRIKELEKEVEMERTRVAELELKMREAALEAQQLRKVVMTAEQNATEVRRLNDTLVLQNNQLRQQLEVQRATTPSRGAALLLGACCGIVAFALAALTTSLV